MLEHSHTKGKSSPTTSLLSPIAESGPALDLLRSLMRDHPFRSNAVDAFAEALQSGGIMLDYQRIADVNALYAYLSDKCSKQYYRMTLDSQVEYSATPSVEDGFWPAELNTFTADKALFIIVHPNQREGSWISLAHHNFTRLNHNNPELVTEVDTLLRRPLWAQPHMVNFRHVLGYDSYQQFDYIRGVQIADCISLPITLQVKDQSLDPTNPSNMEYPYFADVEVRVRNIRWHDDYAQNASFQKGWKIFGIHSPQPHDPPLLPSRLV